MTEQGKQVEIPFEFNKDWFYFPISEKTFKPLKGWQKISSNKPEDIKRWLTRWPKSLFGLDTGKSGLVVMDIDTKNGKDGNQVYRSMMLDNGLLPDNYVVNTPSGGKHIYLKGKTKNRVGLIEKGLDVRSVGGYVIAPGVVKAGKKYEVVKSGEPAYAPEWLVNKIGAPNIQDVAAQVSLVEYDIPHNVQKAINYLKDSAPVADEGGRDDICYKVACRVRDFGISKQMAKSLFEDYYSSKVETSDDFSMETALTKVDSAFQYACDRPGNDTLEGAASRAAEAFANMDNGEEMPAGEEFEEALPPSGWTHISDFTKTPAPDRKWIIENWLPAGSSTPTLIAGDGGTGKSLLAMQLALSVASGTDWLGEPISTKMPVAMVMCEDSDEELHRRIEAIAKSSPELMEQVKQADVYTMSRVGKDCVLCREDNGILVDMPFMLELHQQLLHLGKGEKLLILDTVADIYAGNESNRTAVTQFLKHKLCGLAAIHNATIAVIAHPPKSGARYSGSTAWNNSVRNRLYLGWNNEEREKSDFRKLSVEKSNYSQCGTNKCINWVNGVLVEVDEVHTGCQVEALVLDHIVRFNAEEDMRGGHQRLSNNPQAKYAIWRRNIYDPMSGKRLKPQQIKDALSRLAFQDKIFTVTGRSRGNGIYAVPKEKRIKKDIWE